jgi:group I intron endonuclease
MSEMSKGLIGIYQILNSVTGKAYVGSSYNVTSRWRSHLRHLITGSTQAPCLLLDSFTGRIEDYQFSILELCTLDQLVEREQHWIDKLKPAYNLAKVAARASYR